MRAPDVLVEGSSPMGGGGGGGRVNEKPGTDCDINITEYKQKSPLQRHENHRFHASRQ